MKVCISVQLVYHLLMRVIISRSMKPYPKPLGPGMFQNLDYLRLWKAIIERIFCISSPGAWGINLYSLKKLKFLQQNTLNGIN